MVRIKTEAEIDMLRQAARLVERVLVEMAQRVAPGVTTLELDAAAERIIRGAEARPAFKGYRMGGETAPFPGSICASVNDVVVHGIPSEEVVLSEGDLLTVDCGVELDGYFGDFAYTYPVGEVSAENRALLDATKQSLYAGIEASTAGKRLGDIGYAVQSFCEERGYGVVRELVGHGIGTRMHESPQVPNFGRRGHGKRLKAGMTICIEPMINRGTHGVTVDADGWTVRTADGLPSAHYEHMVAVRGGESEILSSFDAIEAALAEGAASTEGAASPPMPPGGSVAEPSSASVPSPAT